MSRNEGEAGGGGQHLNLHLKPGFSIREFKPFFQCVKCD